MAVLNHVDDEIARYCCEQIINVAVAGLGLMVNLIFNHCRTP